MITFFFVDMTQTNKNVIQTRFEMLLNNYDIRVMFATKIYELKINNFDIEKVF